MEPAGERLVGLAAPVAFLPSSDCTCRATSIVVDVPCGQVVAERSPPRHRSPRRCRAPSLVQLGRNSASMGQRLPDQGPETAFRAFAITASRPSSDPRKCVLRCSRRGRRRRVDAGSAGVRPRPSLSEQSSTHASRSRRLGSPSECSGQREPRALLVTG